MDSSIKVLSPQLSNMIAAGEVVQRPASVVKELMENAIDAGATKIQVVTSDAGRTLIQVVDNGRGMNRQEAQICFERHATSKLSTSEDLHNILTFGFRGEALPSIAAVAKVTLNTKDQQSELGTQLSLEDGVQTDLKSIACPQGTNIIVRDLFYNIPARRKFLKSDSIELRHIVEEFVKIALRSTSVALSLTNDSRVVYDLRPAISLKARIRDISGATSCDSLLELSSESDIIKISGFVGTPESVRKTGYRQYFFVNGRYFRSPYFNKAIMQSYEGLVPEGSQPSYYLFFEVDPGKVDVNIHPSKIEIKFEEESLIYNILSAAVRQVIGMDLSATIDFSLDSAIQMPNIDSSFRQSNPQEPQVAFRAGYNPFDYEKKQDYTPLFEGTPQYGNISYSSPQSSLAETVATSVVEPLVFDGGHHFAVVHNDSLLVVNTLRAYRRVFFDRYIQVLQAQQVETSPLIFPVVVSLSKEELLNIQSYKEQLLKMGIETSFDLSSGYVEIMSKPAYIKEGVVRELLEMLSAGPNVDLTQQVLNDIAVKLADSSSLKAFNSAKMSLEGFSKTAAQDLFNDLCTTSNPEVDASGDRIIVNINKLD